MYFDRNISEYKYGKKSEGSYLSCVTNGEFYFNRKLKISFKNRFSAPYDLNLIYFQAVKFISFVIAKCPSHWGKNNSAESLLILCTFADYVFKGP